MTQNGEYVLEMRDKTLKFDSGPELLMYAGSRGYSLRKLKGKRWRRIYKTDEDAVEWGYKSPAEKKKQYQKDKPVYEQVLANKRAKQTTLMDIPKKKNVQVKTGNAKVKTRARRADQTQHVRAHWRRR